MRKNRLVWLVLALVWCVLIFTFTAMPLFTYEGTGKMIKLIMNTFGVDGNTSGEPSLLNFLLRKTTHFFVYGILALLLWQVLARKYVLAWLLTTLYAASDEWHQTFMPGRTGVVKDVILDSVGAFTFLIVIALLVKKKLTSDHTPMV